jgi:hypothetical protein
MITMMTINLTKEPFSAKQNISQDLKIRFNTSTTVKSRCTVSAEVIDLTNDVDEERRSEFEEEEEEVKDDEEIGCETDYASDWSVSV